MQGAWSAGHAREQSRHPAHEACPLRGDAVAQVKLNEFLRSHRVLTALGRRGDRPAELGSGERHHVADALGFGHRFSRSDTVPSIPSIRSNLSIHTLFGSFLPP